MTITHDDLNRSVGRIEASDRRSQRASDVMIDDQSDPGSWADAIAHSPCLAVSDYVPPEEAG